jgi:hypothetical protein
MGRTLLRDLGPGRVRDQLRPAALIHRVSAKSPGRTVSQQARIGRDCVPRSAGSTVTAPCGGGAGR